MSLGSAAWTLPDAMASEQLGAALARHCPWSTHRPLTLYLQGELGAGKTTVAQGLLATLGVVGVIRSPSYSLVERYPLRQGVAVHVDLYRLQDAGELEMLGLRDDYRAGLLLLVEWPERGASVLPTADLTLQLTPRERGRRVRMTASGPAGELWLAGVRADLSSQI